MRGDRVWRSGMAAALLLSWTLAPVSAAAQATATDEASVRAHVEVLASERFEGRLTGSTGEALAADYLAAELKRLGAQPLPGASDLRAPFTFTAGSHDDGSRVSVAAGGATDVFEAPADALALAFSDTGEASGGVVFAGYGIVVPASQNVAYDSYAGLEVKDKVVVVLRYFPEDVDQKTRGVLARYSDLRYKAQAARQRGARALVVVTGPRSPNAGSTVPMSFDSAIAGSGLVAVSVTGRVADRLFAAAGRSLAEVQQALDAGNNPHAGGFDIPGVTLTVAARVRREQKVGHNVLAYLPATSPTTAVEKPWVAIGAHYDHLGRGEGSSSLATGEEKGRVHHGADDNASGTAAVLAIARALSAGPRARNVLIAFWSGEELGLLGSAAFVAEPPVPLDEVAAYLNFDMVGRVTNNRLTVQATGTSAAWPRLLEQANVLAGFDLALQADPYQPTDVSSFNAAGVPSLTFFTGAHADYHKPSDTADSINYEDLARVADFATSIVRRLIDASEPPQFVKVEQTVSPASGRSGIRIFTGTIPDYASDVKGLLLGGVVGGGPAEKAGLQKGDVIVELAGQSVANVYDYMYALDLLKVGEPVKVVYMRGSERRESTLTPEARK